MVDDTSPGVEVAVRAPLDRLEQDLARAQRGLEQFDRASGYKNLDKVTDSGDKTSRMLADLESQLGSTAKAQSDLDDASSGTVEALKKQNAALQASVAGYEDHADAAKDSTRSLTGFIGETLSLANHMKGLALVAYGLSSSFRAWVNPLLLSGMRGIATAAGVVGPALTSAGGGMTALGASAASAAGPVSHLAPALATVGAATTSLGTSLSTVEGTVGLVGRGFSNVLAVVSRFALPILAIVTAWKLLNAAISDGRELMEKFGGESRRFDMSSMQEALAELNKATSNDGNVTTSQAKWAADLNTRLDDANFKIKQFMETQVNLHSVGLAFQNVWVVIVELIAKAADGLTKIINMLPAALSAIVNNPATRLGHGVATGALGMLGLGGAASAIPSPGGSFDQPSTADWNEFQAKRQRALSNISAVLGTKSGSDRDRDAHDNPIGGTFTARWNTAINLLKEGEEAADDTKSKFDQLYKSMQRSAAVQEAEAKAVDLSAGEHARLRAELRLTEAAQQEIDENGGKMSDYAKRIKVLADRFAEAARTAAQLKLESDIKFTGNTLFFSDIDKQIAGIMRQIHGKDWQNFMDGPEASAMRLNKVLGDTFQFAKSAASDFMETMAKGWMENKQGADLLIGVLDNLKNALLSSGIKDLVSGDPLQMAVGAVKIGVSFAINAFTADAKAQQQLDKAKLAFANMSTEVQNFNSAASGFELSQFVSAMQQVEKTGLELIKAAVAAQNMGAVVQLIQSGVAQINNQVNQFAQPKADSPAEKIKQVQNEGQQIIDELATLNQQYNLHLDRTADILAAEAKKIDDIKTGLTKSLQADINTATGKGFLNDIQSLVDSTKQLQDQATATSTNPSLIARRFDAMAQKVVDDAQLTGQAFSDLTSVFPQLIGHVHEYTAAVDDNAAALEKATNDTAKNIVDYLNQLRSGPGSTDSPQNVFAASQAAFNANLPLAQLGNLDAQNKFPELADNLEKAARALYGSSQGYQDIKDMIVNLGLALPAVQQTTDPVVASLRDVLQAIQANGATQALDATLQNVIKTAIDSGNAQAIAALLVPKFDTLTATTGGTLNFAQFVQGLGPQYADVATGVHVGGLLTQTQLSELGLSRDKTTGALLTSPQLQAAGLASDTTVSGLLTKAQLDALHLSTNATVGQVRDAVGTMDSGNLLSVFNGIAGSDGLINKTDAVRTATDSVYAAQLWVNGNVIATAHAANDTKETVQLGNAFLDSMNDFTARVVAAINGLGSLTASVGTGTSSWLNLIAAELRQGFNIGNVGGGGPGTFSWLGFQGGGYTGDGGTGSVAGVVHGREFVFDAAATSAIGLRALNFAKENRRLPTNVVPLTSAYGGAGDAGATLAELRRLNDKVDRLETELKLNTQKTADGAVHVREGVDAIKGDTSEMKRTANMRH